MPVKSMRIFAMSMLLNLALAAGAAWLLSRSRAGALSEEQRVAPATNQIASASVEPISETNTLPSVTFNTNRFSWSQVETNDFEQLATNLRALGCPEKTVQELVVARARRALERVERETQPKLAFWTGGVRRERAGREWQKKATALRDKILASVDRAIGPNIFTEESKFNGDFAMQAIARFIIGPIPENKFSQLVNEMSHFQERRNQLRFHNGGISLDDDETAAENLKGELRQSVASFLTPAELEELTARTTMMHLADAVAFDASGLSPAEIRQVALLRARASDTLGEGLFEERSLTDEQRAQFFLDVKNYLGDSKYASFERASDSDFKAIIDITRESELSTDAAVQAYDLRKATQQEMARLRADSSLSESDRAERILKIQIETADAMQKVLGTETLGNYMNRGGSWITNVISL